MTGSNEALADAVSGVVGTLVSLWCFYPIERIKTNLQAGKSLSSASGWSSTKSTSENDTERIQRRLRFLADFLQQSFRGCMTKSMHATSSSFCYFYFYSWILSYYNNKRKLRIHGNSQDTLKLAPLRPSTRLALSAIAAMMNTFVTLPLDVLSSKRTVECDVEEENQDFDEKSTMENSKCGYDNKEIMEKAWKSVDEEGRKAVPSLTASTTSSSSSSSSSSSTEEMEFHEACSRSEDLFDLQSENKILEDNANTSIDSNSIGGSLTKNEQNKLKSQDELQSRRLCRKRQLNQNPLCYKISDTKFAAVMNTNDAIECVRRWSKLWKGLAPALLLCSNPSIHYTVFDMLKTKVLAWKRLRNQRGAQQRQLSVSEAFVLGLLSKFVATIVTYPLIRAKVLMMVGGPARTDSTSEQSGDPSETTLKSSSACSPTLWSVLKESYFRDGGISGLYKGCDWQLIHTLLKSALMMAIREQITDTSRAMFGVSSK